MALTDKQRRFVDEYLIDLNATQAAVRAGYSKKTAAVIAAENLAKPNIFAELQTRMKAREQRTQITHDYVLTTIRDTIERCAQSVPVRDKDGEPTGEYKFDATAVLKGAELLGKHLKMFTDKVEHSGEIKNPELRLVLNGVKPTPAAD